MSLPTLLEQLGVKAGAAEVYAVINDTLGGSAATLSALTEAIAATIHPGKSRVISDEANEVWAGTARRIVDHLVQQGELSIQGREVRATGKLVKPAPPGMRPQA